jgi:hypothetical protein
MQRYTTAHGSKEQFDPSEIMQFSNVWVEEYEYANKLVTIEKQLRDIQYRFSARGLTIL